MPSPKEVCSINSVTLFFADQSKAVLLLLLLYAIYVSYLSLLCCLACSLPPCDHLLGKAFALVCLFLCVDITSPYGVPGQVWYLIVSIPYLCPPLYFLINLAFIPTHKLRQWYSFKEQALVCILNFKKNIQTLIL